MSGNVEVSLIHDLFMGLGELLIKYLVAETIKQSVLSSVLLVVTN